MTGLIDDAFPHLTPEQRYRLALYVATPSHLFAPSPAQPNLCATCGWLQFDVLHQVPRDAP